MGTLAKPTVTERFAVIVSTQPPRPEQAPDQPVNFEPEAGASVRVTAVPLLNGAEQVAPQLIPAGELVTVPEPEPLLVTVRVRGGGGAEVAAAVAAEAEAGGGGGGRRRGPATRSSFVTKASPPPLKVVSKAPAVVGKSAEAVYPVT